MEVRLTALILGEVGDIEAAVLRTRLAADPTLAALYRRLEAAATVFQKTFQEKSAPASAPDFSPAELKKILEQPALPGTPTEISADRRAVIEKLFATPATVPVPEAKKNPPKRRVPFIVVARVLAAAACVALLLGVLVPMLDRVFFPHAVILNMSKSLSDRTRTENESAVRMLVAQNTAAPAQSSQSEIRLAYAKTAEEKTPTLVEPTAVADPFAANPPPKLQSAEEYARSMSSSPENAPGGVTQVTNAGAVNDTVMTDSFATTGGNSDTSTDTGGFGGPSPNDSSVAMGGGVNVGGSFESGAAGSGSFGGNGAAAFGGGGGFGGGVGGGFARGGAGGGGRRRPAPGAVASTDASGLGSESAEASAAAVASRLSASDNSSVAATTAKETVSTSMASKSVAEYLKTGVVLPSDNNNTASDAPGAAPEGALEPSAAPAAAAFPALPAGSQFQSNTLSYAGNTTVNSGTLQFAGSMSEAPAPSNIPLSGKLYGKNITVSGGATSAIDFGRGDHGPFTQSSANTYAGGTTMNVGTLNVVGGSTIIGGTLQYIGAGNSTDRLFTLGANGGTLDASSTGALTVAGGSTVSGTGTLILNGGNVETATAAPTADKDTLDRLVAKGVITQTEANAIAVNNGVLVTPNEDAVKKLQLEGEIQTQNNWQAQDNKAETNALAGNGFTTQTTGGSSNLRQVASTNGLTQTGAGNWAIAGTNTFTGGNTTIGGMAANQVYASENLGFPGLNPGQTAALDSNGDANAALNNFAVQSSMDYESQYIFRGKKVTNQAYQPSAQLGFPVIGGSANAGIWTSQPTNQAASQISDTVNQDLNNVTQQNSNQTVFYYRDFALDHNVSQQQKLAANSNSAAASVYQATNAIGAPFGNDGQDNRDNATNNQVVTINSGGGGVAANGQTIDASGPGAITFVTPGSSITRSVETNNVPVLGDVPTSVSTDTAHAIAPTSPAASSAENTRQEMLRDVDAGWTRPEVYTGEPGATAAAPTAAPSAPSSPAEKLRSIVIPGVHFTDLPLNRVIEVLNKLSAQLDPQHKGVNLVVVNTGVPAAQANPPISLSFHNATLGQVLDAVAAGSGYAYQVKNGAVVFSTEADQPVARPASPVQFPPPVAAADNPYSTFALNVSDASYRLALAALQQHQWPDPANVRTEEFLNAFNYHDPAPAAGEACVVHDDLAQNPFETGRDLLRVSFQTAATGRDRATPLRLTLLLDNSGSMTRADRVATLQAAIAALGAQLRPWDTVSLVTFARTPQVRLVNIPAERFAEVADTIAHLVPDGGTNLEEALKAAYAIAGNPPGGPFGLNAQTRVVLLTDGAANLGDVDPQGLAKIVDQARRAGIALDAYGVGWDGYDDTVLEALTRHSDGRYAFLNGPQDVNDAFAAKLAGALAPAALDVKLQIEFNPARVTTYRLMGYNNLRLTKEQFRDNSVAAGELAAAEQGTALYSLVLNPNGSGPVGTARARFRDPATGEVHEWSWNIPYQGTPAAFDQATPALRLAAVAAYFAEYLQQSPYAAEVTPRLLLNALHGAPEALAPDPRPASLVEALTAAAGLVGN
jgi:hypothetical protein